VGREQEPINTMNQALLNNQKNLTQVILMISQSETNDVECNLFDLYIACQTVIEYIMLVGMGDIEYLHRMTEYLIE
jgi:hypothetical protein